jgi:hypothetical protein
VGAGELSFRGSVPSVSLEEHLVDEIRSFNDTIDVSSYKVDSDTLIDTLNKVNLTYPDIFYLDLDFNYSVSSVTGNVSKLKLTYDCTQEEYTETIAKIDARFADLIASIGDDASDYEKALLVHDYICTNFAYDTSSDDDVNHKLDGFVEDGTGVCQAYMSAYSYVLEKLGIESYPVVSAAINHTWNMVKLDGQYYQVDVTWDDFVPDLLGWAQHSNFLMTDEEVNGGEHGTEWHTYEDGISATDDTFYTYAFRRLRFPVVTVDNRLYCIDNGEFCEYNLSKDVMTPIADIISGCKWYNYNATIKGSYYTDKYSSLNPYGDVVFYNTPNEVIAMDLQGNTLDVLYSREVGNDNIFGITIRDGVLLAQVETTLNAEASSFGTNVIQVCNVEEWYQNHLGTYSTVTEATTVTEPLVTTTAAANTTTEQPTEPIPVESTTSEPKATTAVETTTEPSVTTTTVQTDADAGTDATTTAEQAGIKNVYSPDVDGDGSVDGADLLNLKSYLMHGSADGSYSYDVNGDGSVDVLDVLILKSIIINQR